MTPSSLHNIAGLGHKGLMLASSNSIKNGTISLSRKQAPLGRGVGAKGMSGSLFARIQASLLQQGVNLAANIGGDGNVQVSISANNPSSLMKGLSSLGDILRGRSQKIGGPNLNPRTPRGMNPGMPKPALSGPLKHVDGIPQARQNVNRNNVPGNKGRRSTPGLGAPQGAPMKPPSLGSR
ncbi:hypothetical protein ACSAM2_02070 [Actinomyces oris]|uniref:hypothetical protein n=1 Tax=Actinomyces TaxID=1654 RepID=UPI0011461AFA|nr:hypothetical protein [Actinomyces oris]